MLSGSSLAVSMQIGTYAKLLSKWVLPHAQQQQVVLSPLRALCTLHGLVSAHLLAAPATAAARPTVLSFPAGTSAAVR